MRPVEARQGCALQPDTADNLSEARLAADLNPGRDLFGAFGAGLHKRSRVADAHTGKAHRMAAGRCGCAFRFARQVATEGGQCVVNVATARNRLAGGIENGRRFAARQGWRNRAQRLTNGVSRERLKRFGSIGAANCDGEHESLPIVRRAGGALGACPF